MSLISASNKQNNAYTIHSHKSWTNSRLKSADVFVAAMVVWRFVVAWLVLAAAAAAQRFSLFFTWAICSYLHVSSQQNVDRICKTADHVMHRSRHCSALYFGVSDEFCSHFADFARVSGGCFDTLALFRRRVWECLWSDVQVVPHMR